MEISSDSAINSLAYKTMKTKRQFFIKTIPSKDCCFEILSFAFFKEEVERLLRMLCREARTYLSSNQDMIEVMKSMI